MATAPVHAGIVKELCRGLKTHMLKKTCDSPRANEFQMSLRLVGRRMAARNYAFCIFCRLVKRGQEMSMNRPMVGGRTCSGCLLLVSWKRRRTC